MTPELMDKLDRFREKTLARDVPSADVERWLGAARPCATLSPHVDGPVVGRLGGPLMLPPDLPDPEGFDEMHLIASLDLAALPADATSLPLPQDGRLLLFACPDPLDAHGTAIYIPAGTPVEERPMEHDYGPQDWLAELDAQLREELRLRYDVSLPDHDEIIDAAEHPHAKELREAWSEVRGEDLRLTKWSQLQIDGYAMDEYGDVDPVVSSARWAAEEKDRPESGGTPRPEDWVLLAQWHPDISGWESAIVYWAIARQDLAARRFDQVYVSMFHNP
ncbi:hypothetical protein GCM10010129_69110 [Streptomyces fumigatiscleroticus]|nr:hypothetical protein GCM10010129_69110 [Streptomyces fumigatiscleroticus]